MLSVAAAAHGFAVFVLEGVLVNASDAETLAESAARAIVEPARSTP